LTIHNSQFIIDNAQLIIRMGICRTFFIDARLLFYRGFALLHPCLCS